MDQVKDREIRFERQGRAGLITLCRPESLNALSHRMIRALTRALLTWAEDPAIEIVVVQAEGRAFCAGGDLMEVYQRRKKGGPPLDFFADEYRLNALIARYPKPYVSLVDGIAMGGGVGLAFHGPTRIMTERAEFAMPEVGIGFFPDVGGTCILSGVKGSYGMYMALTGNRMHWGDALWTELATYAVPSDKLSAFRDDLCETADADTSVRPYAVVPPRETDDATLYAIATHFSRDTLRHVLASLKQAAWRRDEFARQTLMTIKSRSPMSVAVTFAQIAAGAMLTVEEALRMEFRILTRMLRSHDFYEGIRATLIEKDGKPLWRPSRLSDVEPSAVDAHFAPLGEDELVLWNDDR